MKLLLSILFGLLLTSCTSVQNKTPINYRAPPDISETSATNAIPLKAVNPLYPRKAAMERISGWVQMEFDLDKKGHPTNIIILDSHPGDIFVRAAVKSVSQWTFSIPSSEEPITHQQYIMEFKIE